MPAIVGAAASRERYARSCTRDRVAGMARSYGRFAGRPRSCTSRAYQGVGRCHKRRPAQIAGEKCVQVRRMACARRPAVVRNVDSSEPMY
jgi:hypothetical protein